MSAAARSTSSETSAKSRAGRIAVPAKMTSSMPAPRIDLGEDSPITQRIASSTLDLPQPLGPTTPVRPSSIRSSAGSTKLLKPVSFSRFTRMTNPREPCLAHRPLDQRLEHGPCVPRGEDAVDEEGGRARNAFRFGGSGHLDQPCEAGLVGKALPGALRRDAADRGVGSKAAKLGE